MVRLRDRSSVELSDCDRDRSTVDEPLVVGEVVSDDDMVSEFVTPFDRVSVGMRELVFVKSIVADF